jgi:hypothetical protein
MSGGQIRASYTGKINETPHGTPCTGTGTGTGGDLTYDMNDCHYVFTGNTTGADAGSTERDSLDHLPGSRRRSPAGNQTHTGSDRHHDPAAAPDTDKRRRHLHQRRRERQKSLQSEIHNDRDDNPLPPCIRLRPGGRLDIRK